MVLQYSIIEQQNKSKYSIWLGDCENKSTSKSNIMIEALAQAARRVPPGGKHRPVKVTAKVNIGNDPQVFTQSQYL